MDALTAGLLALAGAIGALLYFVFGSFWMGAGYEPTRAAIVARMIAMAELGPTDTLYDLGAGTGAIVFRALRTQGCRAVAIEGDPTRAALLRLRRWREPKRACLEIRRQNLLRADLRSATVIAAFLWPGLMARLGPKLEAELAPGTRIVSYFHPLPGWIPDESDRRQRIYLYRIPARAIRSGGT